MVGAAPVALGELAVGLVLAVGVEVEDALDEVLAEHLGAVLQQQVQQAVLTQAETQGVRGMREHAVSPPGPRTSE